MTELTISLPDSLREFIDTRVSEGGYGTADEYIQALIREAQKRDAQEALEAKLLEGLESGEPTEMTVADWVDIRRRVQERLTGRTGA